MKNRTGATVICVVIMGMYRMEGKIIPVHVDVTQQAPSLRGLIASNPLMGHLVDLRVRIDLSVTFINKVVKTLNYTHVNYVYS